MSKRRYRFRIDPVLPVVYDDALSYYEAICKLARAVDEMGEEIDQGLIDFIKEALPELIAEATYDDETGTLELVLIDDVTDEQILNDPIKRISVNGISRPVMDEIARAWFNSSWLYNKNVCMYGDSTLVVPENYAQHIVTSGICASVDVRGVSGNSLVLQGYNLINNASDLGSFDYVFVCYGINDWSGISRKRFTDAVRATAQKIINAGADPVFVFPWLVYIPSLHSNGFINNYGCDMAGYVDGAVDVCEQMHVKYFNLCGLANVTESNYASKLTPSSNGYYLHESAALGDYIARIILNGNYCTGKCKTGDFVGRPFKTFLPYDFSFLNYANTRSLLSSCPVVMRKGKTISFTSGDVRSCKALNTGEKCRITGFVKHSEAGGYVTIGYINEYDNTHTFTPICRTMTESDFDFTFTPPNGGAAWRIAFEASSGSAIINDLTIASNLGDCRVVGPDPAAPAGAVTIQSGFNVYIQPYTIANGESVVLTPFAVRAADTVAQGATVAVAQLDFYPMHTFYGSCHIGGRVQLFRINAVGLVEIYVNAETIGANAYIFFDGIDVTPTPFFNTYV